MDYLQPVYTETTECQDCYKCLRQCSVKAIEIRDGHAKVIPELCVMCGHCVRTCPVGAKRVRSDIERAKVLLNTGKKVIVSLAPSFIAELDTYGKANTIAAIKKLGFAGVSETALGAQEVSANIAKDLQKSDGGIYISSACPTVVEMVKKYYPEHSNKIVDFLSPLLSHCKLLKKTYGEDIGIVFVGPCISKKVESDRQNELLDISLTFAELREWWRQEGIEPENIEAEENEGFLPGNAEEGSLYPIDGGMVATVKANCFVNDAQFMTFSGIDNIKDVLEQLDDIKPTKPLFIEMLACKGGCVNGPCVENPGATALKRSEIIEYSKYDTEKIPRKPEIDITDFWDIEPVQEKEYSEQEIRKALEKVGKFSTEDELNCSGCGYDSCRDFAKALLEGKAEPNMCVGYMRQLAHKKADALIKTIPCGVVMVDENLRIVECNRRFCEFSGEQIEQIYDNKPGLEKASLEKVFPFSDMFEQVLVKGKTSFEKDIKHNNYFLHLTIFTIEPRRLVGAIVQDITSPSVQKERIIKKARQVMNKNVETVQKIAYLLGENAADSEVILKGIVDSFEPESLPDSKEDKNDIRE